VGFSIFVKGCKQLASYWFALYFIFFNLGFATAHGSQTSCAERIHDQIPLAIEVATTQVKENDRYAAQRFLRHHQTEIESEVYSQCPHPDSCSLEQLSSIVAQATLNVLERYKPHKGSWAGSVLLWGTLTTWVAVNVWISTLAESKTAVVASSLLTVIGSIAITKAGGARLDVAFENLRRWGFAADRSVSASERGSASKRHLDIYSHSQGLRSTTEMEGRSTDREGITQLSLAGLACKPQLGESNQAFLIRSADVLALALFDLSHKYPELEFSEPDYANWVRVLFSNWHLNDSNREAFRQSMLELIQLLYDKELDPGGARTRKYERAIRAWTLARPDITLPLDTHQSQIELPLHKAEDPSRVLEL
jgi:hypothetical protein